MTSEQFASWLTQWLSRHPIKSPSDVDRAVYTQEVMTRLGEASRTSAAMEWHPAWRLAFGGALAAFLLVLAIGHRAPQLARQEPAGEAAQLAQVLRGAGEDPSDTVAELDIDDAETLAEDAITTDRLMLAEAPEESMWQELEALNQLEQDPSDGTADTLDEGSDADTNELLDELEWMDNASSESS